MATRLYLKSRASDLGGAGQRDISDRMGRTSQTFVTNATSGGTDIQCTATAGGQVLTWFTPGVTEGLTISGTVTVNIRGLESANTVNAGRGILIERTNSAGVVQSTIVANTTVPAVITEYGTTDGANGAATYTPTSTAMAAGERIKITLKVRNVGTMGTGTVTNSHDGPASGAAGDTWVQFNEDIRFDFVREVAAFEYVGAGGYG